MDEFRWEPWTPQEVAARLAGVKAPWAFAGGWALDLFRGEVTRDHEDTEITLPAGGFGEVRTALATFEFDVVGSGRRWPGSDERAMAVMHQTWFRDPSTGAYKLDVFREPHDGDTWICRRDRSIRLPFTDVVRQTVDGLPSVAPAIVLLFKAREVRPKDASDFEGVAPLLDAQSRRWLVDSLERVHPGHAWIARLRAQE